MFSAGTRPPGVRSQTYELKNIYRSVGWAVGTLICLQFVVVRDELRELEEVARVIKTECGTKRKA